MFGDDKFSELAKLSKKEVELFLCFLDPDNMISEEEQLVKVNVHRVQRHDDLLLKLFSWDGG